MKEQIERLFKQTFSEEITDFITLKPHASARQIFRIKSARRSVVAVHNSDLLENSSFIYLSKHFLKHSLPVPEIFAEDASAGIYLEEDLGDLTLYDFLTSKRSEHDPFPKEVELLYQEVLTLLPKIQIKAGADIDYSKCYNRSFVAELMLKDMHYFRDEFLLQTKVIFDPQKLEQDFANFINLLTKTPADFFLYRDFQSRNIMLREGRLFFIDYQGGCKGVLQYDIASILFQAQAKIPYEARERLLQHYMDNLLNYMKFDRAQFEKSYYAFVYLRLMQVLGTYGLRGLKERRQYFIDSISYALKNLEYLLENVGLPAEMPEFKSVALRLIAGNQ